MTAFPHLLAPGAIGSMTLRNRILMAPMGDSLANADGTVSDAQLAYFEARARGGAALLLIGSVAVAYPDGCVDERQVGGVRSTPTSPGSARWPTGSTRTAPGSPPSSPTTARSRGSTSRAADRCSCPRSRPGRTPTRCR